MPYINLTFSYEKPVEDYIAANWVRSEETNCFKKHFLARAGHLILTPWSAMTAVAETIVGIGAGIASIGTAGLHKGTCKFAMDHLYGSRFIVMGPYINLLRILNPSARFSGDTNNAQSLSAWRVMEIDDARIRGEGDGFISDYVTGYLGGVARRCRQSDNLIKRHIASRLTYALLVLSCIITRVVDGIIGIIAAPASFLTLGKVASINNLAYRALQAPALVKDLFYGIIKMCNPWAGTGEFHF